MAENPAQRPKGRTHSILAWGDYACFTRPEFSAERVTYEVITPSAARGVLDAVLWKPGVRWQIERIHVLAPIRTLNLKRNEVATKGPALSRLSAARVADLDPLDANDTRNRVQRNSVILKAPRYRIDAHLVLTRTGWGHAEALKHDEMFARRLERGQVFQRPFFGMKEFPCEVAPFPDDGSLTPPGEIPHVLRLGRMFYDWMDTAGERRPLFFDAVLREGVMDVPPPWEIEP